MKGETPQIQETGLSSGLKLLLLAAGAAVAVTFISVVTIWHLAYRASRTVDRAHLERAVRLNPLDAEYRYKLATWFLYGENNAPAASQALATATRLNPHEARYWLALATAKLQLSDANGEFEAVRKAAEAAPTTPEVAWEAGTHLLISGHEKEALQTFHTMMKSDPLEYDRVLNLCWRALHDQRKIVEQVLPRDENAYLTFFSLLMSNHEYNDAAEIWKGTVALGKPIPKQVGLNYIDDLLRRREVSAGLAAWRSMLELDASLRRYREGDNVVTNGHFEEPLLNDGFDWRFPAPDGPVAFSLDSNELKDGSASLLLDFKGDLINDTGLYQLVAVDPGAEYIFRAIVKSSELASASALRFEFRDGYSGDLLGTSGEVMGSTGAWVTMNAKLRTPANTQLIKIGVGHGQASHIAGKMWIDSVELKPQGAHADGR